VYRLVRIDKRVPDGSIWQARRSYLLSPIDGWTRVYGPAGTRWSNPLGGWTTRFDGISIFHPARLFTASCSGPAEDKRFYIDIAHRVRVTDDLVEFTDLFLDVMIDSRGAVTEKDESQLAVLQRELQTLALTARDEVRRLIEERSPLFDSASPFYSVPPDAVTLEASVDPLPID
jgi:hypothetical protein